MMNTTKQTIRLSVAVISTVMIAAGANMAWIKAGGLGFEPGTILTPVPVDPNLLYLAAAISGVGLLVYVTSRNPLALGPPLLAALGAGAILAVDLNALLDDSGYDVAGGPYVVGIGAGFLLLAAITEMVELSMQKPGAGQSFDATGPPANRDR